MQFANSQVFGKVGSTAIRELGRIADGHGAFLTQNVVLLSALEWLSAMLLSASPRTVRVRDSIPVLIFADGACEPMSNSLSVTIGAVMFDSVSGEVSYFGTKVPQNIVERLIGQAELFPVSLAKAVWAKNVRDRTVLYLIDNNAARFSLIMDSSPVKFSSRIVQRAWLADVSLCSLPWYGCVPIAGNIADGPSRLMFDDLKLFPHVCRSKLVPLPGPTDVHVWTFMQKLLGVDSWHA